MAEVQVGVNHERKAYGEVLRWCGECECMYSEGIALRAYENPARPLKEKWVNKLINLGVKNPLREELSGDLVTEEQVRQALVANGSISEDHEGTVLRHGKCSH